MLFCCLWFLRLCPCDFLGGGFLRLCRCDFEGVGLFLDNHGGIFVGPSNNKQSYKKNL
jgi:hypothetical protein